MKKVLLEMEDQKNSYEQKAKESLQKVLEEKMSAEQQLQNTQVWGRSVILEAGSPGVVGSQGSRRHESLGPPTHLPLLWSPPAVPGSSRAEV